MGNNLVQNIISPNHKRLNRIIVVILASLVLVLAACNGDDNPIVVSEANDLSQTAPTVTPAELVDSVPPTPLPSPTTTPYPTSTPPPSPTPTSTPTQTPTTVPTPTPTPLHPLSIERMRQQVYPGSEIAIEETLEKGANYSRYLASYLSEGFKIYALLTVPDGPRPESGWPVVVFNHGYIPPAQYRTTERYIAYVDGFARSGYIVFRSDYRGHGNSEGIARGGYGSPDYTIDVLNAVSAIKQHPDADADRIGMWGHSMGGYITLRSMVVTNDIKAGVIWAGVVASYADLLERWRRPAGGVPTSTPDPNSTRGRWRNGLIGLYGAPDENPTFWDSISANSYLADLSGPVQLHHGSADETVPIVFSELLEEQILNAGGTVEYYDYEGDNHNLSLYFTSAMGRSIGFFDKYVKNANN